MDVCFCQYWFVFMEHTLPLGSSCEVKVNVEHEAESHAVFQACELERTPVNPSHRYITGAKEAFFILMSGWDGRCQNVFYYFLFFPSIAGINNVQGHVLIWSSDSESVCSLFSAPSHIWGHTLTVMACSSLSRTNSSVCSHRKVFIRIIRTFLSPRLVGSLVYLKQEL